MYVLGVIAVEIYDSIVEKSFKNKATFQSLVEKYPTHEQLNQIELVPTSQFEDPSRTALRQYSIEQLQYFYEEAQSVMDQLMNEELTIQKLAIKINKRPVSPSRNYREESWEFLLSWPKNCKNIDQLIFSVKSITSKLQRLYAGQICQHLQRAAQQPAKVAEEDSLEAKYEAALARIGQLERLQEELQDSQRQQQKEPQSSRGSVAPLGERANGRAKTCVERMQLINDLELKLMELENEKDQTTLISLDAFSKILAKQ